MIPLVIDYSLTTQMVNKNKAAKILNNSAFMLMHYTQSLNSKISPLRAISHMQYNLKREMWIEFE